MQTHISSADFYLAGIQVRTSNLNGQAAVDIGKLWGDFFAQELPSKIQGKISGEMICAYTDYASDMNGPYTAVLGYQVDPETDQPAGVTVVAIETGLAAVYDSVNADPQTILETWMRIWSDGLDRAYRADYDLYHADGTVQTFVSVSSDASLA